MIPCNIYSHFLCQLRSLLILLKEQHVDHHAEDRDRSDQADRVHTAGKDPAKLIEPALFISRLIAPIAAKQGAHSRLNTRNA